MKPILGHSKPLGYLTRLAHLQNRPQTYLFTGKSGIGKKLAALYFGKALFCGSDETPCGVCSSCKSFDKLRIQDVIILSPDEKGKIRVGDAEEENSVRWFVHRLSEKPISGKCFALVDGVEKITAAGQNILLKTVEEPGKGIHIVMLASSLAKVLTTIKSRAVKIEFNPLKDDEVCKALGIKTERHSIEELAVQLSGGSPGIADNLMKDDGLQTVLEIGKKIKEYIEKEVPFIWDGKIEEKALDFSLIDILINCYHVNYKSLLNNDIRYNRYLDQLYIDDIDTVHSLIKKLLKINGELRFNINLKHALKAALVDVKKGVNDGIYMY